MRRPTSAEAARLAGLIGLAGALALAELLFGLAGGAPQSLLRADAFAFLAVRPWILLAAVFLLAGRGWRVRLAGYGLFLAAVGLAEAGIALRLGNPSPWAETARGWAASALILTPLDLAFWLARRRADRSGAAVLALAAAVAALAVPQTLAPYRAIVLGPGPDQIADARPGLLLMTSLPIIWGEGGAFDPQSRPAESYRILQDEFVVRAIDTLDAASLAGADLLLLAQPRWLAPAELVAFDRWVRAGGRALILTDPRLEWPSDLPLGDIRRPPPVGLLKPLLDHWGLALDGIDPVGGGIESGRRLVLPWAGRFRAVKRDCAVVHPHLAECRLGTGRALLIADADLMRDDSWMAPGGAGTAHPRRLADNPLAIADHLDALAGIARERRLAPIRWARPGSRASDLAPILLPLLAATVIALAAALLLHRRRRA